MVKCLTACPYFISMKRYNGLHRATSSGVCMDSTAFGTHRPIQEGHLLPWYVLQPRRQLPQLICRHVGALT